MQRILVIRGGAIGDFVLTLPAIALLRAAFPEARLEILGYKHIAALAEGRFYAEAVRSIESASLAGFFARDAELAPELCDYFRRFDLIVSYLFDPDLHFETNLRRCGIKEFLAGSPKIESGEHASIQLARPLRQLAIDAEPEPAKLYPSAADRARADDFLKAFAQPIIALHPGSGGEAKKWPLENWLALGRWLRLEGSAHSLLIVGGEADVQELGAFAASLPGPPVHFAESLSLTHLAAVLQQCALFIGHDSGISHIAAAVGTPSALLFGPTEPSVWAPRNQDARVLRAPNADLKQLALGAVQEFVAQELMRIGIST